MAANVSYIPYLFGQGNCISFFKKTSGNSQGSLERDVFGNHVIPVKLAGELSQPLDSLRTGCDGLHIAKFIT